MAALQAMVPDVVNARCAIPLWSPAQEEAYRVKNNWIPLAEAQHVVREHERLYLQKMQEMALQLEELLRHNAALKAEAAVAKAAALEAAAAAAAAALVLAPAHASSFRHSNEKIFR